MKVKQVILAGIVAGLMAAALLLPVIPWLVRLLERVGDLGLWGPVALGGLYVVSCVFLIPASIPTLAAGFLFDLPVGSITALLGCTAGACVSFLVGRTIARDWVAKWVARSRRFTALDRAVGVHGFKIVLLSRLGPLSPFVLVNYVFGLTRVRFWEYALGTLIGVTPGTTLFVYFGAGLRSLAEVGGESAITPAHRAFFWIGLLVTIVITAFLAWFAHRALRKAVSTSAASDDDSMPTKSCQ
jgi:uncharacterized membrane protein YdjX (TVP38/TMEM64 family)